MKYGFLTKEKNLKPLRLGLREFARKVLCIKREIDQPRRHLARQAWSL
jgi:DNA-directed RNA polymerase subunit K/omega